VASRLVGEHADLLVARPWNTDFLGSAAHAAADLRERERLGRERADRASQQRRDSRRAGDHVLIVAHGAARFCADFAPLQR
jgi:hypothetical protein